MPLAVPAGAGTPAGLWLIKTELLETQTVDFSVGAEGLRHVRAMLLKSAMMTMLVSASGRVLAVTARRGH
ncbi:hypothetical protein EWT57_27815 [Escherichia coli O25b:H4]|nr:hypothetical protein EWT57_27815 [Escherichia coli O25b:H4]